MEILFIFLLFLFIFLTFSSICCYEGYKNTYELITIYVINLDKRKDRLDNLNIKKNYIRVSGIDGSQFESITEACKSEGYPDLLCLGDNSRKSHKGAIGCYLSHLKCLKLIKKGYSEWGLILEDDAVFLDNDFNLEKLIDKKWDIIFLNAYNDKIKKMKGIPNNSTHAMLINKRVAGKLLNLLEPNSEHIKKYKKICLYDWILFNVAKDFKCKWYSLVKQNKNLKSDISKS